MKGCWRRRRKSRIWSETP